MATMSSASLLLSAAIAVAAAGCAQTAARPSLYPNDYYRSVGSARAERDVEECIALADEYAKEPTRYTEVAKSGVVGGALGAGAGALAGTITKGKVGRATAAGAAVGTIAGIATELRQQSGETPTHRRFVEHCLEKQGYEVVGS